jgi:hypothetical protein
VRVWSYFVLTPLLLVFSAPLATADWTGPKPSIVIPAPISVGLVIVLLMGAGNYIGTRQTFSAVAFATAVVLVFGRFSELGGGMLPQPATAMPWATSLTAFAVIWAARPASNRRPLPGIDRVWTDFREAFGIVWSRRIQDRINERAAHEDWELRLVETGFIPATDWGPQPNKPQLRSIDVTGSIPRQASRDHTPPHDDPRIEHALRWHLRRFVDDLWIDQRLGIDSQTAEPFAPAAHQPLEELTTGAP